MAAELTGSPAWMPNGTTAADTLDTTTTSGTAFGPGEIIATLRTNWVVGCFSTEGGVGFYL